jgi:hypothetical protein
MIGNLPLGSGWEGAVASSGFQVQQPACDGIQEEEERQMMQDTSSRKMGYVLAALLGGIGGGLAVALATRAIPQMISQMMSGMMQNMMAQMREGGCDPQEM